MTAKKTEEPQVDETEAPTMRQYVIRKVGPFALYDPEGEEIASDKKDPINRLAVEEAERSRDAGHDTQIVTLDEHERVLSIKPFYPSDVVEDLEFEEDPDPTTEGESEDKGD